MKRCPKCKTEKQLTEFGNDRTRPDGLSGHCKACCCAYQSKYRYDNKEMISEERASYYRKNRKSVLRRMQHWQQDNPEKVRLIQQRRRSMKAGLFDDDSITPESVDAVFSIFNNRCAYCGKEAGLHRDHVVPIAAGGPHIIENIVPACHSCNASKGDLEVMFWFERKFDLPTPQPILDAVFAVSIFQRIAA